MENNSDRMGFALIALSVVAVVLLIMNTFFGPTVKGFFKGFNKWQESTFSQINISPSNKINPDDAKWVEKGNYGTNGYFVRDNTGNGIVYALNPQQPVIAPETAIFTTHNGDLISLRFLDKTILPKDSNYYFAYNFNLTTFDTKNLDTSNVTDMSGMFSGMTALTALDLSKFDTSKVTDMNDMFDNMQSLTTLDVSKFNTFNVTDMSTMFYGTNALTALDVSNFNTSNVTNVYGMFGDRYKDGYKLTPPDTSKFDTAKMTNKDEMFDEMETFI